MNKTMEYMAFELPVVAFDLRETRVSAGEAAVYVEPNDVHAYAEAIVALMDDEPQASPAWASWAGPGSSRSWPGATSERAYLGVYDELISRRHGPQAAGT